MILELFSKKYRAWWVLGLGEKRELWARIGDRGRVSFYNPEGERIVMSKYNNFFNAQSTLTKQGFRKVSRRELARLNPPKTHR